MISHVLAEKIMNDVGGMETNSSDTDESTLEGWSPIRPYCRVSMEGFDVNGDAPSVRVCFEPPILAEELSVRYRKLFDEKESGSFVIHDEGALEDVFKSVHDCIRKLPVEPAPSQEDAADEEEFDPRLEDTEALREAKERKGQVIYRKRLEKLWNGRCAVTGIDMKEVLRASHAKPWAKCATGAERLSPYNGFLLCANLDALFDKALITFDEEGRMLVSKKISRENRRLLGIDKELFVPLTEKHQPFMAWHRKMFKEAEFA